jgi:gamma-butyrobetaine dioxygenase
MTALLAVDRDDRGLVLHWSDDPAPALFHHLWLRDNCACAQCRHPQTWERTLDTFAVDPDIAPSTVTHDADGVTVCWPDGHVSRFDADWLHSRRYGAGRPGDEAPAQVPWGSDMQQHLPEIEHADVMADDHELLRFVESAWTHGITFVRHTPSTQEALLALARRVGHLRETNFGVDWHVVAMIEPNNVAYTAIELQLHTDLPNRETPPGFQFLHCLKAEAPGGDSTLADGFWIAEQVRRDDPGAFDLLSTVPIPYRFHDDGHDLRWRAPVIGLKADGTLGEVRFHTALREPLDVDASLVEPLYRALRVFDGWCRSEGARVQVHLEPGDVMVFHNRRVLHGRTSFDPAGGRRELHGAYVDADEWLSRWRVLRR